MRICKPWVRCLSTLLVLGMMVVIYCFSMEDAPRSDATSGTISMAVIHVTHPEYETLPEPQKLNLYNLVQHYVRKTAHFTEYAALGFLLHLCVQSWFADRKWKKVRTALYPTGWLFLISWGAGTLYAVTDELHQLAIDGRSGQVTDVLIDSAGVLTGALVFWLLFHLITRKKTKQ